MFRLILLDLFIEDLVLDELLSDRVDELSGRFTMMHEIKFSNVNHSNTHFHTNTMFNDDDEAQLIHQKSINFYLFTGIAPLPFLLM